MIAASDFENGTALSNGGETLKLEDANSGTITEFRYEDQAPWPLLPDGGGASLVLINPTLKPDPSSPSNWRSSLTNGGNPGTTDALTFNGEANGDLNGNGYPDLIDYASGGKKLPTIEGDTFTYRRKLGADDVALQIEASSDLNSWIEASSVLIERSRTNLGDGTELVELALSPVVTDTRWFFRIRAILILPQN